MHDHEELIGADYTEHNIHHPGVGVTRAVSVLKNHMEGVDLGLIPVGKNQGHMDYLERHYAAKLIFQLEQAKKRFAEKEQHF
jgi:hypothetical protein